MIKIWRMSDKHQRSVTFTVDAPEARVSFQIGSSWSGKTAMLQPTQAAVTWDWDDDEGWTPSKVWLNGKRVKADGSIGVQTAGAACAIEKLDEVGLAELREAVERSKPTTAVVEADQ